MLAFARANLIYAIIVVPAVSVGVNGKKIYPLIVDLFHTGYPETTNRTDNNKHS